ncbi:hypothetical protein GCM10022410_19150 [Amphibacillus indicireducens]|uniref:Uncharacterized protein n=1 Tax=Amphibacillus indicireducens TaxID=1076330 RepID=A0ABP7VTH9_9BACI
MFLKATEYYLNQGEDELTFENKQHIIRSVVREVVICKDEISIHTF